VKKPSKRLDASHVVVEALEPAVDGGRFAAKAVAGRPRRVAADVYSHGHERTRAFVRYRRVGERGWTTVAMTAEGNDRFATDLVLDEPGPVEVEVLGELDALADWRRDAARRAGSGRLDPDDVLRGSALLAEAAQLLATSASKRESERVALASVELAAATDVPAVVAVLRTCDEMADLLATMPPRGPDTVSERVKIQVAREIAGFSSWYECFPRSSSPTPGVHGTLRDLVGRLDYVERLGFDVLYLPPIHPIGTTARKGPGNATASGPDDVGSPWAIGSAAGGHLAVEPRLGSVADVDQLVGEAASRGIEIALDLAFQCSPDHPWVSEHPEWFAHRSDGTIACAENPPKRYEDVFPLDFDSCDRDGLYHALLDVVLHWIRHGVRIFRVDNPHTKPFAFWEWLLAAVRAEDPGAVFLSEAFTRPKVMHRLAKLGFDQSYTYFTWRNTKQELTEYFEELSHGPATAYFRPNVWPNTPDILPFSLQHGGKASFVARLVLAAGLSACYGIYGPVFELLVDTPAVAGTDGDYLHSEKYEVMTWDLEDPRSIADVVARVNAARRAHPSLQSDGSLRFHPIDNEQLLCWSKRDRASGDVVVCIVSLDPDWAQSGFVELDLDALGLDPTKRFTVHDLLDDASYSWTGRRHFVLLDPTHSPAHLFVVDCLGDDNATSGPGDSPVGA
jgi:starch synthase (maltosyl-transferring)